MKSCSKRGCGSFAINPRLYDRDGRKEDLCDVHYWQWRCEEASTTRDATIAELRGLLEKLKEKEK